MAQRTERLCRKIPAHSVSKPCHELKHSQNHATSRVTERARVQVSHKENLGWAKPILEKPECAGILRQSLCSLRLINEPHKGRNSCLRLRPRSLFVFFGVVLMSCKVNFHVVRSAL